MKNFSVKPVNILLVEDNPGDVILTKKAFEKCGVSHRFDVVEDGEKASNYLFKRGEFSEATTPDIIFMDINLPKKDGRQVLEEIDGDPLLRMIPVIILTSSKSDQDVVKSYRFHANSYVLKPTDMHTFEELVKAIESFWFKASVLPEEDEIRKCLQS